LRTIVHLSDLHFGRLDTDILPVLRADILAIKPDVIAVSGDLTQRARSRQFREARDFLKTLPFPKVIVPGNHDVPLNNVISRGLRPFTKYRRYIDNELEPVFADGEIAVLGINTARSFTFKNGRIDRRQVAQACVRLQTFPRHVTRIIVTHHPFDGPTAEGFGGLVGRAQMAMTGFAGCHVDFFLSGHLHTSRVGHSAARYKIAGYSALIIQAGTATSTRRRGEANAYNIIRIERSRVSIDCSTWDSDRGKFAIAATERFRRGPDGWVAAGQKRNSGRHS
jgi:3',5'-cyclic AMP phosphodiesterase CpdA